MTVDKTFHNSDLFLENHHYSVYDNQKIREKFPNAKISWGNGVFDDVMLNLAKDKILQLKKIITPLMLLLKQLTLTRRLLHQLPVRKILIKNIKMKKPMNYLKI